MEISNNFNSGNVNGPKKSNSKQKSGLISPEDLGDWLRKYADKTRVSAPSQACFQEKLMQVGVYDPKELVRFIRSFKKESVIEMICSEWGSSQYTRKKACLEVVNALVDWANYYGYSDANKLKNDFIKIIDKEFKSVMPGTINTEKLDEIVNTLIEVIDSRSALGKEKINSIKSNSSKKNRTTANTAIINRFNQAVRSYNSYLDNDDGWTEKTAEAISHIWGSENTREEVSKDLNKVSAQIGELKKANKEGDAAYKAKFKEIFKVNYDPVNIHNYEVAAQKYVVAKAAIDYEKDLNRTCHLLMKNAPLTEEYIDRPVDPSTNMINRETVTKYQVYNREFENLAKFVGKEQLEKYLKDLGVSKKSMEVRFEALKDIAQKLSAQAKKEVKKACGKETFETIQKRYESSYKAAYGTNDIQKRVDDYCVSQKVGGSFVKLGVTIAASCLGGAAAGKAAAAASLSSSAAASASTVGSALGGAVGTFVAEVSDDLTTDKALDAWKKGDFETLKKCVDLTGAVKQAAITGIMFAGFGTITRGVQILSVNLSPAAQATAMFGANMTAGLGAEYIMTGEISINGVIIMGVFSLVAGVLQFKAANMTKEAIDTVVADAKKVLNLSDSVEITEELLKKLKRDYAWRLHPDNFPDEIVPKTAEGYTLADINNAIDVLKNNLLRNTNVNANVAKHKPSANNSNIPNEGAMVPVNPNTPVVLGATNLPTASIAPVVTNVGAPNTTFDILPQNIQEGIKTNLLNPDEIEKKLKGCCYIGTKEYDLIENFSKDNKKQLIKFLKEYEKSEQSTTNFAKNSQLKELTEKEKEWILSAWESAKNSKAILHIEKSITDNAKITGKELERYLNTYPEKKERLRALQELYILHENSPDFAAYNKKITTAYEEAKKEIEKRFGIEITKVYADSSHDKLSEDIIWWRNPKTGEEGQWYISSVDGTKADVLQNVLKKYNIIEEINTTPCYNIEKMEIKFSNPATKTSAAKQAAEYIAPKGDIAAPSTKATSIGNVVPGSNKLCTVGGGWNSYIKPSSNSDIFLHVTPDDFYKMTDVTESMKRLGGNEGIFELSILGSDKKAIIKIPADELTMNMKIIDTSLQTEAHPFLVDLAKYFDKHPEAIKEIETNVGKINLDSVDPSIMAKIKAEIPDATAAKQAAEYIAPKGDIAAPSTKATATKTSAAKQAAEYIAPKGDIPAPSTKATATKTSAAKQAAEYIAPKSDIPAPSTFEKVMEELIKVPKQPDDLVKNPYKKDHNSLGRKRAIKKEFAKINAEREKSIKPNTPEYKKIQSAYLKDPKFVEELLKSKIEYKGFDFRDRSSFNIVNDAYSSKSISAILEINETNPDLTELAVKALRGRCSMLGWYTDAGRQKDNNIIEYIKQAIIEDSEKVRRTLSEVQQGKFLEGIQYDDDNYYYMEMLYKELNNNR